MWLGLAGLSRNRNHVKAGFKLQEWNKNNLMNKAIKTVNQSLKSKQTDG